MMPPRPAARAPRFLLALTLITLLTTTSAAWSAAVCLPLEQGDRIYLGSFESGPQFENPGPFSVNTVTGITTSSGRNTPWTALIPQSDNPLPLVLFSPGFQISSAAYQNWVMHLATWGYIAVRADPQASLFSISHPNMTLDLRAVLDDMLDGKTLPATVDTQRIALTGHSLGGKIAYMVAASDTRVAALFTFDPVNGSGSTGYTPAQPDIVPGSIAPLTLPMGLIGELTDAVSGGLGPACAPAAQNYQTFFEAATNAPAAYEWTLDGAGHLDFVTNPDQCAFCGFGCQPSTLPTAQTHAFMRSSAVAFLRTHLSQESRHCETLAGEELPNVASLRVKPTP